MGAIQGLAVYIASFRSEPYVGHRGKTFLLQMVWRISRHGRCGRVGALPQYPSNALNYNLTWSTDRLINEYIEPCEAIIEGKLITVPALEEREEFSLDGATDEAFNLKNRRDVLKDLFENASPATMQDAVVIFVTVCGWKDGRYMQETYANMVYAGEQASKPMSAIRITTAAGITTVLYLLVKGPLPAKGFIRQEEIALSDFLSNRFGQMYDPDVLRLKVAG
jgi:saccharopine dehydrogenase-like NADP-dependent oxidoreductase